MIKRDLYDAIIKEMELTTKNLNSIGYDARAINQLIEDGTLRRVKRGHYEFMDVHNLFKYGKKLNALKFFLEADKCFNICYKLDPSHRGNNFQLFVRAVENGDYKAAFKYFGSFYGDGPINYQVDNKLYLYLLSFITKIPEEYREISKSITLDDLLVSKADKRYENNAKHNEIRTYISKAKFETAYQEINGLIKAGEKSIQNYFVRKLLRLAILQEKKFDDEVSALVKEKNIDQIKKIIMQSAKQRNLNRREQIILFLCTEIFIMTKNGKVSPKQKMDHKHFSGAVFSCNFELALEMANKPDPENPYSTHAIYLLLKEVNRYINLINAKNNKIGNTLNEEKEEVLEAKEEVVIVEKEDAPVVEPIKELEEVPKNENDSDINLLSNEINKYLSSIKGTKYEKLFINLIKLSLAGELAIIEPIKLLTNFNEGNYKFDFNYYQENLNEAIISGDTNKESLYYDVVKAAIELGLNKPVIEKVEKKEAANKPVLEVKTEPIVVEKKHEKKEKPLPSGFDHYTVDGYPVTKKDIDFVNGKIEEIHSTGIVLLGPYEKERRKVIHDVVSSNSEIISFSIGIDDKNKYVVIKERLKEDEKNEFSPIYQEARELYYSKKYQEALPLYLKLVAFPNVKSNIFGSLGYIYYKLYQKDKALEYYRIANLLAKEEGIPFDYGDIILSISGGFTWESRKPRFKMSEDAFQYEYDYYGFDNIDEIAEFVKTGASFEEICAKYGFNDEEKMLIGIIFAREYYTICNYDKGDYFYKKASQIKDKPKEIKKLLDEVYKSRNFYWNRVNENSRLLVLSIHKDV